MNFDSVCDVVTDKLFTTILAKKNQYVKPFCSFIRY